MVRNIRDAALSSTAALPNGAATTYSGTFDLQLTSRGEFLTGHDFVIEAPACTTGILPDAGTIKYTLQHDSDSAFGSPTDLYPDVLTQTGAGGVGCIAATKRIALPSNVERYVRVKAVKSGSGNASTLNLVSYFMF